MYVTRSKIIKIIILYPHHNPQFKFVMVMILTGRSVDETNQGVESKNRMSCAEFMCTTKSKLV